MTKAKRLLFVLALAFLGTAAALAQDVDPGSLEVAVQRGDVQVSVKGEPIPAQTLATLEEVLEEEVQQSPLRRSGSVHVVLRGPVLRDFRRRVAAAPPGDAQAMRRVVEQFVKREAERVERRYDEEDVTLVVGREVHVTPSEHIPVLVLVGASGTVDGVVDELVLLGSHVQIGPAAQIHGHALSLGSQLLQDPESPIAAQQVILQLPDDPAAFSDWAESEVSHTPAFAERLRSALMILVASFLAGLLYLRWGGGFSQRSLAYLSARPAPALGYGLLTYLAVLPLALLLVLSVVGLLLLPLYAVAVALLIWLGYIVFGLWLGSLLMGQRLAAPWQRLLLGLLLLGAVGLVPVVGPFLVKLFPVLGVGATVVCAVKARRSRTAGSTPVADPPPDAPTADPSASGIEASQHG